MKDHMWITREPNADDINFIYATWLNSYHYDSWTKSISKSVFFDNYKLIIDYILDGAKILVSCLKDKPNVILGYIIYEPRITHYIFVKEAFRRFGIARELFADAMSGNIGVEITHRTKMITPILKMKPELIFNPFILYKKEL